MLTGCRLKPAAIAGDLKKAFLLIRINEEDRNAMTFHKIKDREVLETVVLGFIGVMFRLSKSPFALEGNIKHHLEEYDQDQPQTVMELK